MLRRTILQSLLGLQGFLSSLGAERLPKKGRAETQAESFPGAQEPALRELAASVLPESLGRGGTDKIAVDFIRYVREYKPGAEMQNGYGVTRVRSVPPSAAGKYLDQLRELSSSVLSNPDLPSRRKLLAERLKAGGIHDLPGLPQTGNLVLDLMTFYFTSSAANDLAYEAAIGRDACRGLQHSSEQPAAFRLGSN